MQYECTSNAVFKIAINDGGGIKMLYILVIKMPLEDNMPIEVMCMCLNGCGAGSRRSLQRNASFCLFFTWEVGLDPFKSCWGGGGGHRFR